MTRNVLNYFRYLNKLYTSRQPMSALPTNVCYLATDYPGHASCGVRSHDQLSDPHVQLEAFRQWARRMVGVASSAYQRAMGRGLSQAQAWNTTTVDWTVAAKVCVLREKHLSEKLGKISVFCSDKFLFFLCQKNCFLCVGPLLLCCSKVFQ